MTSRVSDADRVFSANIRKARIDARLTQPQVAAHLNITYQSYQKMEGGKYAFRYHTMSKLAELYATTVQDFICGTTDPDPILAQCYYLLSQMDSDQRQRAFECIRSIRNDA